MIGDGLWFFCSTRLCFTGVPGCYVTNTAKRPTKSFWLGVTRNEQTKETCDLSAVVRLSIASGSKTPPTHHLRRLKQQRNRLPDVCQ